jgi:hypothetical protein
MKLVQARAQDDINYLYIIVMWEGFPNPDKDATPTSILPHRGGGEMLNNSP